MKFRMTKQRKIILDVLKNSSKALNVRDLELILSEEQINLSTIYRSLDLFLDDDLIHKIIINKEANYYWNSHNDEHYFVCEDCHTLRSLPCFHDEINKLAKQNNFQVNSHEMIIYGLCGDCQLDV